MKKQVGEETYLAYTSISLFIIKGYQGRNLEAGADAVAMEEHYLLACSACFLIEPRTNSPGMIPPQPNPKKMLYSLAYSPVIWRHFLTWGSLLSDDSKHVST